MLSRVRLFALLVAFAILISACQVSIDVTIDVEEDGSGVVTVATTLDEDAVAATGGLEQVRIDDLEATGWLAEGPSDTDDGGQTLSLAKEFTTPEQLSVVMDELTGPEGMFRDFQLTVEDEFAESSTQLTGVVDTTGDLSEFSDADVADALGGLALGRSLEEIEAELEEPIGDAVDVTLTVNLPGGDGDVVIVPVGEPSEVAVDVSADSEDLIAKMWRWGAIAAAVLFVVSVIVAVGGWLIERRAKARAPKIRTPEPVRARQGVAGAGPSGSPMAGPPPGSDATGPVPTAARPQRRLRLVVVESMGVLFATSDDPADLLIPFVREHGGTANDTEIEEAHRQATLGRFTTTELWEAVGMEGDPVAHDARYLSYVRLRNGAREFLKELHRRQLPVACVTNDVMEWSHKLRQMHGFEGFVQPWIVSGEVGVRKPDPGIYEALRRTTGIPYESCLMIDGRVTSLDAAKTLGMSTAWFTTARPSADQRPGHPIVTSFSDFFRRRTAARPQS